MRISVEQVQAIITEEIEKVIDEQFDAKRIVDFYRVGNIPKKQTKPEEQLQSPLSDKQKMTMALRAIRNLRALHDKSPKKWEKAAGMEQIEISLKKRIKNYQPSDGAEIARYITDYYGDPDRLVLLISKEGQK